MSACCPEYHTGRTPTSEDQSAEKADIATYDRTAGSVNLFFALPGLSEKHSSVFCEFPCAHLRQQCNVSA